MVLQKIDDDDEALQSPLFFSSQRHHHHCLVVSRRCALVLRYMYVFVITIKCTVYLHSFFDFFVDAFRDPHEKNFWQSVDEDTSNPGRHFVRRWFTVVHV